MVFFREQEVVEIGDPDNKRENLNDHLGNIDILERQLKHRQKDFFMERKEMKVAVKPQIQMEHWAKLVNWDCVF